ncbi:MAG: glycoside hydrolase family 9 protein, partial [Fibrobacter sp.]|nr:glycoside hydrolase family 9 protein [Fibrobacter sp.]
MKKIVSLSMGLSLAAVALAQDVFITVDQFGYRPSDQKVAVLRSPETGYDAALSYTPGTLMEVVDSATAEVVFSGAPVAFQEGAVDTASGDKIWWFDFSSFSTPGTYFIRDKSDNLKQSFYFRIKEDIYNDILKAAMRMMYYQRVGMAKEAAYAGKEWADAINHAQDKTARLFTDSTNAATERDVSGGWFDAGDFNKYT